MNNQKYLNPEETKNNSKIDNNNNAMHLFDINFIQKEKTYTLAEIERLNAEKLTFNNQYLDLDSEMIDSQSNIFENSNYDKFIEKNSKVYE